MTLVLEVLVPPPPVARGLGVVGQGAHEPLHVGAGSPGNSPHRGRGLYGVVHVEGPRVGPSGRRGEGEAELGPHSPHSLPGAMKDAKSALVQALPQLR